MEAYLHSAEF